MNGFFVFWHVARAEWLRWRAARLHRRAGELLAAARLHEHLAGGRVEP